MFLLGAGLVLALLAAGALFAVTQQFSDRMHRYEGVFNIDPSTRPVQGEGQTFLLVGTDTRSPDPTTGTEATASDWVPGMQRSDVIMLVNVSDDGSHASVVSIPRDSWVPIPGRGMNKINAAYSFGGPSLLVQTVESLTRVRVDHFAVIDFAGFAQMTDAAGGIDVNVGQATNFDGVAVPAGPQHLDGVHALSYVRERKSLPGGDFDRVRRQQNALRALASSATSSGTLASPTRAYGLADSLSTWVGVDDTFSASDLRSFVWGLRDLRASNIDFLTAPATGTGMEGAASVVYLDADRANELWFAMNTDAVPTWVASHPSAALPAVPR
ncbi:LCP family protein [Actinomycetospora corticicola]|uniref:LCP family protein required for cell wall assembly n=1 Tax=Actinomycetospora corticicola TaxID=663602 RepID=A0A7Y9J4C4_9PSEU|nr:LCP family protein [Actinomycetospora corticicola]NYD34554.1 LCP family protein required for cell wall assembly [Actinomycetospora corticicola]